MFIHVEWRELQNRLTLPREVDFTDLIMPKKSTKKHHIWNVNAAIVQDVTCHLTFVGLEKELLSRGQRIPWVLAKVSDIHSASKNDVKESEVFLFRKISGDEWEIIKGGQGIWGGGGGGGGLGWVYGRHVYLYLLARIIKLVALVSKLIMVSLKVSCTSPWSLCDRTFYDF